MIMERAGKSLAAYCNSQPERQAPFLAALHAGAKVLDLIIKFHSVSDIFQEI